MQRTQMNNDSESEMYEVGLFGRIRFAFKAFFAVLLLRPIFVSFDDEEIYARTNTMLLARMAAILMNMVDTITMEQDAEDFVEDILRYSKDRMN